MTPLVDISVVVPVHDEEENLPILHQELRAALEPTGLAWEVVYVDDASRDGSLGVMLGLWRTDPAVRVIEFGGNAGQTAAMAAGFEHSRGRIVVTIDGDLQNDPADIPRMLETLERGYDVVAGWRKSRQDGFILRRLPSIVANRLIALVTGVPIHDTGCTLKVFRREVIARLPIYAEQHRFLPAMSAANGARVCELVVNHRARRFGSSKYGIGRVRRVFFDLFAIKLLAGFSRRPLQYFMLLALPFLVGALAHLAILVGGSGSFGASGQLYVTYFMLCTMASVYFFLLGLLAELAVRASDMFSVSEARVPLTERAGR
ncbi:MAG: glycosyltransferase family 2 protein [Planctomycetes bacterium]|nr:glycosyltransferase family 2 protein [Planctomycetota bacterium]MCB9904127.1 glycosyltransferase family 2 protein [Planctomycetota bacterium]